MPNIKPVPESTWLRLRALERRCDFAFTRETQWLIVGSGGRLVWSTGAPPRLCRRAWHVRIFIPGSSGFRDIIDVSEPYLADALLAAIIEAERREWHVRSVPAPIGGA